MYCNLIKNLRLRAMEKDANIRVHAAIALTRLLVILIYILFNKIYLKKKKKN